MSPPYIGPMSLVASIVIIATVPSRAANLLPLMVYNTILCVRHAFAPGSNINHLCVLLAGVVVVASVSSSLEDHPRVIAAMTLSAFATIETAV